MSEDVLSDDGWEDHMDNDTDDDDDIYTSGPVTCLFCDNVLDCCEDVFKHCTQKHQFDILTTIRTLRLDCVAYIKMINYIRYEKPESSFVQEHLCSSDVPPWDDDKFMQPFDHEDVLLQYDVEDVEFQNEDVTSHPNGDLQAQEGCGLTDRKVTITEGEYLRLLQQKRQSEDKMLVAEEQFNKCKEDMDKMRTAMKELILAQPSATTECAVSNIAEDEDEAYFNSYSHFSIHQEMLQDKVRTESYRDCMFQNKSLFEGKVVLDVGCGTGVLSIFAAQAGASHVIGVDQSDIIYQAMDIVRENNLEQKITLLRGKLEDVNLPVDKVDIIISEWMGYFLLFESMMDTILYARDRYLKVGGVVLPDRCSMSLVGVHNMEAYNRQITFWDDVYGIKMSCMKFQVIHEANVGFVKSERIITDDCTFKDFDLSNCKIEDLQFSSPFSLNCKAAGPLTAIVGYFDVYFEKGCDTPINFSTSPSSTPTHWKQTVFVLEPPLVVNEGDKVEGVLKCQKNRKDPRALIISLTYNGKKQYYVME